MSRRTGQIVQKATRRGSYAAYCLAVAVVGIASVHARLGLAQVQAIQPPNIGTPDRLGPAAAPAISPAPAVQAPPVTPVTPVQAITPPPAPGVAVPVPVSPIAQGAGTLPATEPAAAPPAAVPPAAVVAAPAASAPASAPAAVVEGKMYPVTGIKIEYSKEHPQQPRIEDLLNTEITLGVVEGEGGAVYAAARPGIPTVHVKLSALGVTGPQKIYRSGIAAIYSHIVRYFNAKGIIGVFVVVDANDIDATDTDIRPPERTTLNFVIVTSIVKQVRTVSIGDDTKDNNRVDDPRLASIRDHSPLKAAPEGSTGTQDLLVKDPLDEYVMRLNRQPGRHVDVALSGSNDPKNPGGVTLDYLVSESRPWYIYAQIANTGTKQTNEWRERVGFVDSQLTGNDDVLSVDYVTAGFEASHAIVASYELPFPIIDRLRYKAYVGWNQFTASDVGQSQENFEGTQWTAGEEYIWNFYQKRELFVDLVVGDRYTGIQSTSTGTKGRANYFEPYIGLRMERLTDIASTGGSVTFVGYVTDDSRQSINGLGRTDTTRNPQVLQFDFNQAFFIEPLLAPETFAGGSSTLAHELYFGTRGQWAFNHRLFPEAEDVAGGLYSVRGYPESIVAGDSVIMATAEYRFHLPRALAIQSDPNKTPFLGWKSFRATPQQTYGRPDWDLILRAFVDAGQVTNSRRASFEHDATLVGAGVGVELQLKQNFNLRVDWGAALNDIPDEVKAGSNRFHITSTILY